MSRVVVAVGSNIEPENNIERAAEILAAEQTLLDQAALIRTEPDGYKDQADFLNGAFYIETELDHDALRLYLKAIELRLGRVKGPIKSGPRTIDLDIILWDGAVLDADFYDKHYIRTPVSELVERNGITIRGNDSPGDVKRTPRRGNDSPGDVNRTPPGESFPL